MQFYEQELVPGPERIFAVGTATVRRSPAQARFAQLIKSMVMMNAFLIGMKKCLLFVIYSSIIFWIQHLLSFQFHATQKFDFKQVVDNHSQYADRKKKSEKNTWFSKSS